MSGITFNGPSAVGSALCPEDKRHVLAAYVHRHTHSMRRLSDAEWLACTWFAVKANGRLDARFKRCETSHPDFKARG